MTTLAFIGLGGSQPPLRISSLKTAHLALGEFALANWDDLGWTQRTLHICAWAFMNGIKTVVACAIPAQVDGEGRLTSETRAELERAIRSLVEHAPDALLVPGVTHVEDWEATSAIFLDAFGAGLLLLDPPPEERIDAVCERATLVVTSTDVSSDDVSSDDVSSGASDTASASVCMSWPWIRALSPGLNTAIRLPPSLMAAPLRLRGGGVIRGAVTDVPRLTKDDREMLEAARIDVLVPRGPRRLLGLSGAVHTLEELSEPLSPKDKAFVARLTAELRRDLEDATAHLYHSTMRGSPLEKALLRNVKSVLYKYRDRRVIVGFEIEVGEIPPHEISVRLALPKRVQDVHIHLGRFRHGV